MSNENNNIYRKRNNWYSKKTTIFFKSNCSWSKNSTAQVVLIESCSAKFNSSFRMKMAIKFVAYRAWTISDKEITNSFHIKFLLPRIISSNFCLTTPHMKMFQTLFSSSHDLIRCFLYRLYRYLIKNVNKYL